MRTLLITAIALLLSGCAVIGSIPASSCGWVTDLAGNRTWSCSVTTEPMLGYTVE